MAFSDKLSDLEHLIADAMGNALEGARRTLAEQLRRRSESDVRDARERGFSDLREATARLDGGRTQAEVLTALLEEGGRFASRTALLLTFADGARGWASYGFADQTQGLEDLRLSYDEAGLGRLAAGRGAVTLSSDESAGLARHLGGGAPSSGVLVPLVLHDRIAAALYADQLRGSDPFVPAALQLLVYSAAQVLEGQGARERSNTPTLVLFEVEAGGDGAGADGALPLWDPAAVAAAAAAAPAAAERAPAPAPAPPVERAAAPPPPAPVAAAPLAAPVSAPEPAVPPAPAPWEAEVTEETAPAPVWQPSWQMEEVPAPAAAAEPIAAEEPVEPAPEEAWVYTDQGYEAEAEQTYEGAVEVAAEPVYEETTSIEEVTAEAVEEAPAAEPAGWRTPPAPAPAPLESPESTTSPLYGGALYPSEATMRISRDLLPSAPTPAPVADAAEDSTVLLQRQAAPVAPPPPAPDLDETQGRPAPAPKAAPVFGSGSGSTEVQPPPDLEGPGRAFRSGEASTASYRQQTEENTALHEEARRLARLLVSEIKLYNEEQVEEGRRQRDIYPRLQEDIDRSRQMYEERVDPRVRDDVDYFHQEMINILAGGDAGALGL